MQKHRLWQWLLLTEIGQSVPKVSNLNHYVFLSTQMLTRLDEHFWYILYMPIDQYGVKIEMNLILPEQNMYLLLCHACRKYPKVPQTPVMVLAPGAPQAVA